MHNQSIEQWLNDPMAIIVIAICIVAGIYFTWAVWVTWPSHPERIEKLRKEWGIVPPQNQNLSNDRNKAPRSD